MALPTVSKYRVQSLQPFVAAAAAIAAKSKLISTVAIIAISYSSEARKITADQVDRLYF